MKGIDAQFDSTLESLNGDFISWINNPNAGIAASNDYEEGRLFLEDVMRLDHRFYENQKSRACPLDSQQMEPDVGEPSPKRLRRRT